MVHRGHGEAVEAVAAGAWAPVVAEEGTGTGGTGHSAAAQVALELP